MRVRFEKCDQCLLGPNKIVSDARRREILSKCARTDSHFVCHKSQIEGGPEVCCRGFYDMPQGTNLIRIMERLGGIVFTDDKGQPVPSSPTVKP